MTYTTFFPTGFSLETAKVVMRPLRQEDTEAFFAIAQSPELWTYFTRELNDRQQLRRWVGSAVADREACARVPFTIIDKTTGSICGSTSFANISFYDRRIEIGYSWLGAEFRGTGINEHCKFALMHYAFETMQFERVEIKTDILNERAKRAIRKIGGTEEGVLRSHMQMPHGRRRDSVFFSILKHEWPSVKALRIFASMQAIAGRAEY